MDDAAERFHAAGVQLNAPYYVAVHAEVMTHHRRWDDALRLLDEADAMIDETTRTYFHRPEIHRLRARAILGRGGKEALGEARGELDAGLDLAWQMSSPALALRIVCDRAELEAGGPAEAEWRHRLTELVERYEGQEPRPMSSAHVS